MGRVYTASFEAVAITAVQDLFELTPADDKPISIHSVEVVQSGGTADAGDAQEEMLNWKIIRGMTASGSGGSSPTVRAVDRNGASAGCTCEANNTTPATTSGVTVYASAFNNRVGLFYTPLPEDRITASQADTTLIINLATAPADSATYSGTIVFEELA